MTEQLGVSPAPARESGHNGVAPGQLLQIVQRIEHVEEDRRSLGEDLADIYREARSAGFNTKIIKKIVAERRKDYSERMEEAALLDLYRQELGMT